MQMRDSTGNQTFVYKTNKSRHVFLNSAKNALFSSSVCGSISADKTQPGGGTDVALTSIWASCPCSASHGRFSTQDTPHSQPPHSEGPLPRKRRLPISISSQHSREIHLDAAFIHVPGVYYCVRDTSQLSDGTSGFIRGVSSSFQHSPDFMTISHAHPFEKTNTNDGNASIWCKLERNCSLDQIIVSRYVGGWFQRDTKCAAHFHILTGVTPHFNFFSTFVLPKLQVWFSFNEYESTFV